MFNCDGAALNMGVRHIFVYVLRMGSWRVVSLVYTLSVLGDAGSGKRVLATFDIHSVCFDLVWFSPCYSLDNARGNFACARCVRRRSISLELFQSTVPLGVSYVPVL